MPTEVKTGNRKKPWLARVMVNRLPIYLGYYENEEEAITMEDNFRQSLYQMIQTGRWSGAGAKLFAERYRSAKSAKRPSGEA